MITSNGGIASSRKNIMTADEILRGEAIIAEAGVGKMNIIEENVICVFPEVITKLDGQITGLGNRKPLYNNSNQKAETTIETIFRLLTSGYVVLQSIQVGSGFNLEVGMIVKRLQDILKRYQQEILAPESGPQWLRDSGIYLVFNKECVCLCRGNCFVKISNKKGNIHFKILRCLAIAALQKKGGVKNTDLFVECDWYPSDGTLTTQVNRLRNALKRGLKKLLINQPSHDRVWDIIDRKHQDRHLRLQFPLDHVLLLDYFSFCQDRLTTPNSI